MLSNSRRFLSSYLSRNHAAVAGCSDSSVVFRNSINRLVLLGSKLTTISTTGNSLILTRSLASGTTTTTTRRVIGRDRNKNSIFVPTPRNPKVIASIPEDAVFPTIHSGEYDDLMDEDERERQVMAAQWRPGERKRPRQVAYRLEDFDPTPKWTTRNKRCGAIGLKLGMIPVWDDWGYRHPCTVLFLDSNVVLQVKRADGPDGYDAVQVGAGERKKKNTKATVLGQLPEDLQDSPPHVIREFRITPILSAQVAPEPGTRIHARHFIPGQNVDVSAISKGKGFQGAMKRHNFKGMPASHGTSLSHRALGSTGQCQDPGRVFKGKKMAGRMGGDRVTTLNLRIIKIDRGRNLLYVRGAVPGNKGGFVEIRDAIKRPLFGTNMIEESVETPPLPTFAYDSDIDGSMKKGYELMKPLEEKDPDSLVEEAA